MTKGRFSGGIETMQLPAPNRHVAAIASVIGTLREGQARHVIAQIL